MVRNHLAGTANDNALSLTRSCQRTKHVKGSSGETWRNQDLRATSERSVSCNSSSRGKCCYYHHVCSSDARKRGVAETIGSCVALHHCRCPRSWFDVHTTHGCHRPLLNSFLALHPTTIALPLCCRAVCSGTFVILVCEPMQVLRALLPSFLLRSGPLVSRPERILMASNLESSGEQAV